MPKNIATAGILSRIFNITADEWPKVCQAWVVFFLYRIGFVIGWTVLVAMFVAKYGIAMLPLLFALNAAFAVIGAMFYSSFLESFGKGHIMIATIFAAGFLLLLAMFVLPANEILFFGLAIVAIAVFLNQFKISLGCYVEEMFSPLQSERTFPFIEGAETIGGIVAGLAITFFSMEMKVVNFVYLWIAILFFIVPFLMLKKYRPSEKPAEPRTELGFVKKIVKAFGNHTHRVYFAGMAGIIFLQWILFNLLEFQYTSAVSQNVAATILDTGSGFEHALFHDLGILFLLFSCSALAIQLFVGGRLINSLGVTGSILLHPIVTLLSLFGLTARFNFFTAVLAKNNFTITTVIHNNAFHSAYYALDGRMRGYARELLEGVVRPAGALFGTLLLLVLQKFFAGDVLVFYLNLAMALTAAVLFCVAFLQQRRYTRVAVNDLLCGKDMNDRLEAVEILAQRGHRSYMAAFRKILADDMAPLELKLKVFDALKELTPRAAFEDLKKFSLRGNLKIRAAAAAAMASYQGHAEKHT